MILCSQAKKNLYIGPDAVSCIVVILAMCEVSQNTI